MPLPLNVSETPLKVLLDIALMAGLVYGILVWLRYTKAQLALLGASTLGGAYLLARHAGLALTAWALQGFVAVAAVLLVVVFQTDLRRGLERMALPVLGRRRKLAPVAAQEAVARATVELATARRGALIVLPGREPIERHIEGGTTLGGVVSEPLLLSLFDPNSAGHDGAAVIEGDVVTRFAAHLPLSADFAQLGTRGTRHAAALGLSECCDALTIVVSEERGSVCVARAGQLVELNAPTNLTGLIEEFASSSGAARRHPGDWRMVRRNARDLLLAIGVSLVLWTAVVPGSEVTETTLRARVVVQDVPAGFVLEKVDPEEVTVTASGPRRTLLFTDPGDFELDVDAILLQLGRRGFDVDTGDVKHPRGVNILAVQPNRINLWVRAPAGTPPSPGASPPRGPSRP
jgi:diadenylate cyclase